MENSKSRKRVLVTGGSGFIGTNVIAAIAGDYDVLNIDISPPRNIEQTEYWTECDIRDGYSLTAAIRTFRPDFVLHLAARTDLDGQSLDDYSTNVEGTRVLLDSLQSAGFDGRAVFASSMYVCEPGHIPVGWDDYRPNTTYGVSKVISEKIVKSTAVSFEWVLVRPTSIWGPWFGIPYKKFFEMVLARRYFHMSTGACVKTFGYVENTVAQMMSILTSDKDVAGSCFYLGDVPAYRIDEWAEEIAELVNYTIRTYPFFIFRLAAWCGDGFTKIGFRSPLTSFRLKNMCTDNVHDVFPVNELMRRALVNRREGVRRTVEWMSENSL